MKKILLVDDEPNIIMSLEYTFKKQNFEVFIARDGQEALDILKNEQPDLIILDIMMPKIDGIETCYKLRALEDLPKNVVIAFLTARGEDYTQVAALESGADDFIIKPIKPRVLVSKVQSLLRRSSSVVEETEENSSNLIIDKERYLVIKDGEKITLPKKEFELLQLLSSIPERVFARDEIYRKIWGTHLIVGDRTIDVHIRKLREKLGEDYIQTIKGVGYKYNPNL